jgi:hypothetical protein
MNRQCWLLVIPCIIQICPPPGKSFEIYRNSLSLKTPAGSVFFHEDTLARNTLSLSAKILAKLPVFSIVYKSPATKPELPRQPVSGGQFNGCYPFAGLARGSFSIEVSRLLFQLVYALPVVSEAGIPYSIAEEGI